MNLRSTYPGLPDPPPAGQPMLPPGTYAGRTILITGGGTGLGKAMAVEFARLGGNIVIASRNPDHHAAGLAAVPLPNPRWSTRLNPSLLPFGVTYRASRSRSPAGIGR